MASKIAGISMNKLNALNAGGDINGFMPVTLDEMIVNNQIFKANNH